jgi:hypothetical protein
MSGRGKSFGGTATWALAQETQEQLEYDNSDDSDNSDESDKSDDSDNSDSDEYDKAAETESDEAESVLPVIASGGVKPMVSFPPPLPFFYKAGKCFVYAPCALRGRPVVSTLCLCFASFVCCASFTNFLPPPPPPFSFFSGDHHGYSCRDSHRLWWCQANVHHLAPRERL